MANKLTIQASGFRRSTRLKLNCHHPVLAPDGSVYKCLYCGDPVTDTTEYKAAKKLIDFKNS